MSFRLHCKTLIRLNKLKRGRLVQPFHLKVLNPPNWSLFSNFVGSKGMAAMASDKAEGQTQWEFSCDLEVDYESEEIASIVYTTLAVDKELQPDKVKRQMSVSFGKLSVHFEAVEARFLRASYSAFVDVLTLATKTVEEFGKGMEFITPDIGYDFNSPEALLQHPVRTPEPGEPQASNKWKTPTLEILSVSNPWRNTILGTSCVIAVLFDPLFFYIPYIKEEEKCMGIDKQVQTAALVFRSITDINFLVHIFYQLRETSKLALSDTNSDWEWKSVSRDQMILFAKAFSSKLSWRCFLTDSLAVLPIPQVLIVAVLFKMKGPRYLEDRKAVSFFILVQYLPRMYRIYIWSTEIRKHAPIWLKAAFYLFMYIIAGHILGAFWYFFSILRVTSCWHQTYCKTTQGCTTTYYCDDTALINIPLINGSCPLSPLDPEKFDFGMFSDGLQSGNTGPISFSVKLSYSLWWGVRNLSNFGTSLETSTYVWENFFAILISVVGLILFSYLIGHNMQQCMQRQDEKKAGRDKFKSIEKDIKCWTGRNKLRYDMEDEIMKNIKKKLEDDVGFDATKMENLFSILPSNTKRALQRVLCMSTLGNVPMLRNLDVRVLKMVCDCLKPVTYTDNTVVFGMGEPLDRMVFISYGFMLTYTTAAGSGESMDTNFLEKGDSYGKELLQFASRSSLNLLPTSAANVRCHTKVEAFVLMATDLRSIVSKCENLRPFDDSASQDDAADQKAPLPWPFPQATDSGENSP